jgi:CubicO group peptidase (beta-lactamase class C family)
VRGEGVQVRTAWYRCAAILVASLALALLAAAQTAHSHSDPTPQTVEEFQAAAARVLQETGVAGAGIALVRHDGVEWEGGIGYADRDRQTPVTADTHFRVGSISKTFVAIALVQLAEDGVVRLDDAVEDIAPEITIDNPWHETDPVRVIHLLEHTAGFDDMHFKDRYVPEGAPELSLADVLRLNPRSRRVRWRPGTRWAYSNPGYGLAGYLIEKLTKEPYEDYIKREILDPLDMGTSSFRLTAEDEPRLARGYGDSQGPPVGFPRIVLRPAGNLHSSPREMGRFVRMLLGWGELGYAFVIDPEYLGNMEQPRTTLAAEAGLRNGYGSGIATLLNLPYPMLGHGGGIEGFLSSYAYSPARDIGYVILLNSSRRSRSGS